MLLKTKKNNKYQIVISRVGTFFTIWSYFITILCIWSAYVYMYIAAFGIHSERSLLSIHGKDKSGEDLLSNLDVFFNLTFFLDIGLRFFVDYYDKQKLLVVKKQPMMAINYLQTELFYDLIATIPFYRMIKINRSLVQ